MQLEDIIARIEGVANPRWQAPWDKSGLQFASTRLEAAKMAVGLDPAPEFIGRALEWGAEFILTHHPLALRPELPNRLDNYYYALRELAKADAALYAAHTSLDVNPAGPAGWLARRLRLGQCQILEASGEGLGYGLVGNLPAPAEFGEFMDALLSLLDLETCAIVNPLERSLVSRVAYCGGSGSSLVGLAEEKGAQIFISGDIKYHAALEAWTCLADVGHHSIEEKMMKCFADDLRRDPGGLEIKFFGSESPFRLYKATETWND